MTLNLSVKHMEDIAVTEITFEIDDKLKAREPMLPTALGGEDVHCKVSAPKHPHFCASFS